MGLSHLAPLLVLMLLVSGCTGPDERPTDGREDIDAVDGSVLYALGDDFPWETTTSDGTKLYGHIYVPAGEGPFATILVYSPYWDAGGGWGSDNLAAIHEDGRTTLRDQYGPLMDAGFAVAAVSIRGTGYSEGCYSYMNHPANGPDANHVIKALAGEPWSTGSVGMFGISYPAATQFAAMASEPVPEFKAAVAASGEWDEWNLLGRWGTARHYSGAHPPFRDVSQGAGADGILWATDEGRVWAPTPHHICQQTLDDVYEYQELWRTGDKTPFFDERDLRDELVESTVPLLATFGLLNGEGHILQSEGLWDLITHDNRRMMLGQHGHAFTGGGVAFATDYAVPWFDHFLRAGPEPTKNVVDYQVNNDPWRQGTEWPPAGNRTTLFLEGDTMKLDATTVEPGSRTFVAQQMIGLLVDGVIDPGACDIREGALWVSPALRETIVIAGNWYFEANITVTGSDDTSIIGHLWHGPPEAPCTTLAQISHSDLRHRGGDLPAGAPFPQDALTPFRARSNPLAHEIPAGHVLSLFWGPEIGVPAMMEHQPAVIEVHMGATHGSSLALNVVEGTIEFGS